MITRKILLPLLCAVILLMAGKISAQPERAIQFQKYIVKEGETPALIAEKFNIKKKDFLMLNNFPSTVRLTAGEEVLIRQLKEGETAVEEGQSGGQYSANNGASISSDDYTPVSKPSPKSNSSSYSGSSKKASQPAETVTASSSPAEKPAPVAAPPKSVQTGPNGAKYVVSDNSYHIVAKGQTFYRIALIYGLTVDKLKELNNMTNTNITVGQKLRVK